MADVDVLARNLIAGASRLADRGAFLALGVAVVAGLVSLSAYLTGLAALSGSARTLWMLLGGGLLLVIVGAPVLARWRLRALHRHVAELFEELRRLLMGDDEARRVVIDIEEAESDATTSATGTPAKPPTPVMMAQSQRYGEFQRIVLRSDDLLQLPGAIRAITTFPALLAIGLLGTLLFGMLGFVFLLAWAF